MKKSIIVFILFLSTVSMMASTPYKEVRPDISIAAKERIARMPRERAVLIDNVIKYAASYKREATAYVIAYMPEAMLDTVSTATIRRGIDFSYEIAKDEMWSHDLNMETFFYSIFPYAKKQAKKGQHESEFFTIVRHIAKDQNLVKKARLYLLNNITIAFAVVKEGGNRKIESDRMNAEVIIYDYAQNQIGHGSTINTNNKNGNILKMNVPKKSVYLVCWKCEDGYNFKWFDLEELKGIVVLECNVD